MRRPHQPARDAALLMTAVVAGVTSCGSTSGPSPSTRPVLGEQFTLAVGESTEIAGTSLVLTFREVLGDSRCPSDALILCAWEGDAEVAVHAVAYQADPAIFGLHTNDQFKVVRQYAGFEVRLVSLDPYPVTTNSIPEQDYRLRLTVGRRR